MTVLTEEYIKATRDRPALVNWRLVEDVYRRHEGIPVLVGTAVDAGMPDAVAARTSNGQNR